MRFVFPVSVNFNALFRLYSMERTTEKGETALNMCLHTLRMMAKGGIHDHVAQVFETWMWILQLAVVVCMMSARLNVFFLVLWHCHNALCRSFSSVLFVLCAVCLYGYFVVLS